MLGAMLTGFTAMLVFAAALNAVALTLLMRSAEGRTVVTEGEAPV